VKRKPVCFVAMAFSRDDTDELYDRLVLPVLRGNDIRPVIINRRQSNQDLNIQIMDQLSSCDLCLADLTYARQSVYFEAGFAEARVPVIYTVRSDHLDPGQPDHLRAHFDLQMKPLITWSSPDDSAFKRTLDKRIRATFLPDWSRKQKIDAKAARAEQDFASLPQEDRLILLRKLTMSRLRRQGHRKWSGPPKHRVSYQRTYVSRGAIDGVYSIVDRSGSLHLVSVHAFPCATKAVLLELRDKLSRSGVAWELGRGQLADTKSLFVNRFVMSLRAIPSSRIEDVFSAFTPQANSRIYAQCVPYSQVSYNLRGKSQPATFSWHFLPSIKSEPHLGRLLDEHIDTYVADQRS
jgi:nucleoside 2-deoxyribosyltransferase